MKSLVLFPGRFGLDELGAVRVVASNLFPGTGPTLAGSLIGMSHFVHPTQASPSLTQIDLQPEYLRKSRPYRALAKACRVTAPGHPVSHDVQRWVDDRLSINADHLAARQLELLLARNPAVTVALGFSSMSLAFGRAAKLAGKRFALHCQWCHPSVQNALVADGYRALGFPPPPVSIRRVQRQLAEFELADIIWCPSEFVQRSLVANGVSKEKTFVVHLGVDTGHFRLEDDRVRPEDPFLILFVGNVGVQKGIGILLEGLVQATFPKGAKVVLNGSVDPIAKGLIDKYEAQLGKKNILIRVDAGDPRRYHGTASVLVLPSLHDAYGIVVPEAMAAGVPVIVSDHAGAHEIVEHGATGFVFPSGDVSKFVEYLERIHHDVVARRAFRFRSTEVARQYDIQLTARKLREALS